VLFVVEDECVMTEKAVLPNTHKLVAEMDEPQLMKV
jgi:hypothetical protein